MSVVLLNKRRRFPTLDLATMRTLRYMLNVIGSWPSGVFDEKKSPLAYLLQCLNTAYALSYLTSLMNYYNQSKEPDFFEVSESMIAGMLATVHLIRIMRTLMPSYGKDIKDFVEIYHLYYIKDVDERHTQIYNFVEKLTKMITSWQVFICLSLPVTMVFTCVILNYRRGFYTDTALNGTEACQVVGWKIPGVDLPVTSFYHYCFDFFYIFVCGSTVLAIPTMVTVMVFHMIGHIFLIVHKLERLSDDRDTSAMVYDVEGNNALKVKIADIVKHHCTVLRFRDLIADFGGMMIVANYCYQLICGCMLMLVLTSPEKLKVTLISLSTLVELVSISFLFEMIGIAGDKMSPALYQCPWEKANVSNRRSIILMLMMLQRPLQIKGLNIVVFGFHTMAVILRTSFSYFILLRSVALE